MSAAPWLLSDRFAADDVGLSLADYTAVVALLQTMTRITADHGPDGTIEVVAKATRTQPDQVYRVWVTRFAPPGRR